MDIGLLVPAKSTVYKGLLSKFEFGYQTSSKCKYPQRVAESYSLVLLSLQFFAVSLENTDFPKELFNMKIFSIRCAMLY